MRSLFLKAKRFFYAVAVAGVTYIFLVSTHNGFVYDTSEPTTYSDYQITVYSEPWQAMALGVPLLSSVCGLEPDKNQKLHRQISVYLKSLAMFNYNESRDIIFMMDQHMEVIEDIVKEIPKSFRKNLRISIVPTRMTQETFYLNYSRKCSPQRLFLVDLFPQLDSLIYVDVDVVFLRHLDALVNELKKFDPNQYWAFSGRNYFCPGFVQKPCYNAGLILMNITRLRNYPSNITREFMEIKRQHPSEDIFGDQFIINAFLHLRPHMKASVTAEWDYNHATCRLQWKFNFDKSLRGIALIHGSGGHFTGNEGWDFRTIFEFIENYRWDEPLNALADKLAIELENLYNSKRRTKCDYNNFVPWATYYVRQFVDSLKTV